MENRIIKFPRTPHIEGSRLQDGDGDLSQIPLCSIAGKRVTVTEKVDGANVGISFSGGELMLQSRGHYLTGGHRERDYELFKIWATTHRDELYSILSERYIMYGEWLYAKHKIYYNRLPHYFLEFDIFDRDTGEFLDTGTRMRMLNGSSVCSVPILFEGEIRTKGQLTDLITQSRYIAGDHIAELCALAEKMGVEREELLSLTDPSALAEGVYLKLEEGGRVSARMKFVRHGYTQVSGIEERWHARRIIPNGLYDPDRFI